MKFRFVLAAAGTLALALTNINCGKSFSFSPNSAILASAATTDPGTQPPSTNPPGPSGGTGTGDTPNPPPPTVGSGSGSGTGTGTGDNPNPPPTVNPPPSSGSGAVECTLNSSSRKIVLLSGSLEWTPSNQDKYCMTPNACAEIGKRLAALNCQLPEVGSTAASASSGAQTSCTTPFPGSGGTCKGQPVIPDSTIEAALKALGV